MVFKMADTCMKLFYLKKSIIITRGMSHRLKEDKNSNPQFIRQSHITMGIFKCGTISKLHLCKADVLNVQLKQSNFMASAENVNKLCNFVLKCLKCMWKQNICRSNLL